jgi:hypothetical protein
VIALSISADVPSVFQLLIILDFNSVTLLSGQEGREDHNCGLFE